MLPLQECVHMHIETSHLCRTIFGNKAHILFMCFNTFLLCYQNYSNNYSTRVSNSVCVVCVGRVVCVSEQAVCILVCVCVVSCVGE